MSFSFSLFGGRQPRGWALQGSPGASCTAQRGSRLFCAGPTSNKNKNTSRSAPLHVFPASLSKYIKIVQSQGTHEDHRVHLPDHFRANQKLKHVTKGITRTISSCALYNPLLLKGSPYLHPKAPQLMCRHKTHPPGISCPNSSQFYTLQVLMLELAMNARSFEELLSSLVATSQTLLSAISILRNSR